MFIYVDRPNVMYTAMAARLNDRESDSKRSAFSRLRRYFNIALVCLQDIERKCETQAHAIPFLSEVGLE
jgi:hypothetical protein